MENERTTENAQQGNQKPYEEITLKFGKGCVGDEFTGKDGKAYKPILVPNPDKDDKRPWQTFVAKSSQIHENKFGKGMWMKLPAEGHTTLHRSVLIGEKPDGSKEWGTEKTSVTNAELKAMVESYKDRPRESVQGKIGEKKAEAATVNAGHAAPARTAEASL